MRYDSLDGWLHWLESLRIVRVPDDAFFRAQKIAQQLHLFPDHSTVITVGGTNGKGSVVAVLESIYNASNYRVGAYTSPHLFSFNERIKINDKPVEDSKIVEAFQAIDECRKDESLNYFQFATLVAFLLFKQSDLDVWLLEVGVGGRLDTVNLIDPDVAVITQVGWDHCDVLGDTLEQIAVEKAGIMRKGKPVIVGEEEIPDVLFSKADALKAPLLMQGRNFQYEALNAEWSWHSTRTRLDHLPMPKVLLQNASTALMAIDVLQERLPVARIEIERGLERVKIFGRCTWIEVQGVNVLLDVAHNPSATPFLLHYLKARAVSGKKYAVVGMMQDKDIAGALQIFKGTFDEWFLTSLPKPRGANCEQIQSALKACSIEKTHCYENPMKAIDAAFKQATSG
ncbi:MAG: bifunctional folylpolyglutamate synthase/dihydrofolate synthase, partial [Gammaproteobacteria bacterium]|nr:bifunctional folylpolyglutamate synthase/dihydrofolate synthase [Gammaproteobacteria bacterium]